MTKMPKALTDRFVDSPGIGKTKIIQEFLGLPVESDNEWMLSDLEKASEVPNNVLAMSHTTGGYLDVEETFFTIHGKIVDTLNGDDGWLVVGNYYGSATFKIVDGKIERIPDVD